MADNRKTCLGILLVFVVGAAVMVGAGLYYVKKLGTAGGEVVDAGTGAPVAGAEVELFATFESRTGKGGDMPYRIGAVTGDDGRFRVVRTVNGSFRLTIRHPDYETLRREGVRLKSRTHVELGRFELERKPEPAPYGDSSIPD